MLDGYCSSESGLHCRATFQARRVCKQSYVPASAKKKELNWSGRGHLPLRNNKTEQPRHGHVTSWGSLRLCFWGHGTMDHPLWLLGFEALQCFAAVAAIIYQHKSTAATTNSLVLHSVARLYVVFDLWVDLSWVVEPQKYQNHMQNSSLRLFPKPNFTEWPVGCSNYLTILYLFCLISLLGHLCVF